MFEDISPEEWRQFAGYIISIIGGVALLVLGIAGWTLRYIIRIERSTSKTQTACTSIDNNLTLFQTQNEQDHRDLHDRIDQVEDAQNSLSKTVVEQGTEIRFLKQGNCHG